MAKNPKNTPAPDAADEQAQREFEELRAKLRSETDADMIVLRALLDAEKQARGIEQAANDYAVGSEWRISEAKSEIDAGERAATRDAAAQAAKEAAAEADKQIAAVKAEAEKRRAAFASRFEASREAYIDQAFAIVTGAQNE